MQHEYRDNTRRVQVRIAALPAVDHRAAADAAGAC
jgi:hypothetical protein